VSVTGSPNFRNGSGLAGRNRQFGWAVCFTALVCVRRRYHGTMPDDQKRNGVADLPDPDDVYRNYLETCKLLGVSPTPRDRAKKLIEDWSDALAAAAGRSDPPTPH